MSGQGLNYRKIRKLPGWLAWTDYELMNSLLQFQNSFSDSALLEIGVHHGKSFVVLANSSNARELYAIDIFDDQRKNIDHSGKGNLNAFKHNLARFGVNEKRVTIDQRMSTDVQPTEVEAKVGKIGFFHIDGGHHYNAVLSDIKLAVSTSEKEAIIVLDDVFRPEWPDVSAAALGSGELQDKGFVVFAIGFNKTYFCKKEYVDKYQKELRKNPFLERSLRKIYNANDEYILIYQQYPLPEWGLFKIISWYLSVWHPFIFNRIRPLMVALRKQKNSILNKFLDSTSKR